MLQIIERLLYKKSNLIISTLENFSGYLEQNNLGQYKDKIIYLPQLTLTPMKKNKDKLAAEKIKLIYSGSLRKNNHLLKIINFIDRLNKLKEFNSLYRLLDTGLQRIKFYHY